MGLSKARVSNVTKYMCRVRETNPFNIYPIPIYIKSERWKTSYTFFNKMFYKHNILTNYFFTFLKFRKQFKSFYSFSNLAYWNPFVTTLLNIEPYFVSLNFLLANFFFSLETVTKPQLQSGMKLSHSIQYIKFSYFTQNELYLFK